MFAGGGGHEHQHGHVENRSRWIILPPLLQLLKPNNCAKTSCQVIVSRRLVFSTANAETTISEGLCLSFVDSLQASQTILLNREDDRHGETKVRGPGAARFSFVIRPPNYYIII